MRWLLMTLFRVYLGGNDHCIQGLSYRFNPQSDKKHTSLQTHVLYQLNLMNIDKMFLNVQGSELEKLEKNIYLAFWVTVP
jgi:hypothetical protein